jgi:hypothetical protein
MYAGRNGDVYKKTEDGWQQYDRGSREWQMPAPQNNTDRATTARAGAQNSQLERDARARQQGYQRFERTRTRGGRSRGGRRGRR